MVTRETACGETGSRPVGRLEPVPVVYVIASMITGGTQTHLLQVFRFLDRDRFRPRLYCLRDRGDLLDAARDSGVEVETFAMTGGLRNPCDLRGLWRMFRRLRRDRPAVVHGYLLRGNFFAAVSGRAAGVPVVVTSKRGLHAPAGLAERLAVATSNRLSDVITGNSPAVLEFTRRIEKVGDRPMQMIPSGIDPDRFRPCGDRSIRVEYGLEDRPVLGTAITFRPRKGFAMLFRVVARLVRSHPRLCLLVAGAESHSEQSRRLAEELGILEHLVLLGRRSDMPRVLEAFDVFVLPSESEGMSNALLEAMAMEIPVVATDTGGNALVTGDGEAGFIVDYQDDTAMAQSIDRLLADSDLRRSMGSVGRRRVLEGYSSRSMVSSMEALYERLLEDRGARPGAPRET